MAGTATLSFASSWRDEVPQQINITASYDGGAAVEVLRWSWEGPNFHDDAPNEFITVDLGNPEGASTVELTFGMLEARNDWWWAIDNIEVSGTRAVLR